MHTVALAHIHNNNNNNNNSNNNNNKNNNNNNNNNLVTSLNSDMAHRIRPAAVDTGQLWIFDSEAGVRIRGP